MKIYNMEQRSEDWHKIRYGKIGGTASSGLHVKDGETLLNALVSQRLEPYSETEGFINDAMQRGIDLEPEATVAAEAYLRRRFHQHGWIERSNNPLMGYSPDGLTKARKEGLEIKSPSAAVHTKYLREDIIPLEYVHQVIHPFAVNAWLEKLHFISFRPESKVPLFIKTVLRSDEINIGTKARPKMEVVGIVADEKIRLGEEMRDRIKSEVERIIF